MLKKILAISLLFIPFVRGFAQDQITTVTGAVIDCKITSVDSSGITFVTKYDNSPANSFGNIETIKSIKLRGKTYVVSELSKEELNNLMYKGKPKPNVNPAVPDQDISLKIDLIFPSIAMETRAGKNGSTLFSFQPGFVWQQVNNEPAKTYIIPQVRMAYRNFYNFDKRRERGKRTNKFSGDFLSLSAMYTAETEVNYSYISIAPTAGVQRAWGNVVHFCFEIGAGVALSQEPITNPFFVVLDLRLGFAL